MLRAPSLRHFAAAGLASVVAVFGVLALRVHDGKDPALGALTKASSASSSAAGSSSSSSDDSSDDVTSSADDGASASAAGGSSAPSPGNASGWSSGAPTTRAS